MPEKTSPQQIFNQINQLINSSRFNEAFLLLRRNMQKIPSMGYELQKMEESESTYKYLLDYIASGHQDPSRKEVIEQIRDSLYRANEHLLRECRIIDSSDIYSSTRRMKILKNASINSLVEDFLNAYQEDNPEGSTETEIKVSQNQANAIDEIFNYVWTMSSSPSSEYESLGDILSSESIPEYLKLSIVSAIILGLTEYFEPEAYELLLSVYENSHSTSLQARAITGVILISLLHSGRLKGNINLRSRLLLTIDDENLRKMVKEVLMNIVKTYDTQRIDNKMRNELIPGLMKLKPEIINKIRNLSEDSDNFLSEANPDWEELLENSEIGDKLQEINEMQLEGADVMVTAFSNLKGFPFFSKVSNWFLPLIPGYFEFENLPLDKNGETFERLKGVMCDSDLHSFLISMKSMPEAQSGLMISNMEKQIKEVKEAMSDSIGESESDILNKKIRQTLQDLYRFFKFFRKKDDFKDPFAAPFLASHVKPLIKALGVDSEDIRLLGEFYFQKKYYDEAAGMFELYDELEADDFTLWEKIGFSHDRMNRPEQAVIWYKKAEIVDADNPWLHKKIAVALKNAGKAEEAKIYYEKALENDPENYHLLLSAGQCFLDTGEYDKALSHFYHANYIKPEKRSVKRALAWAEMIAGHHDKALPIFKNLTEDEKADKSDFLAAGHSAMAVGDFKSAISHYKKFISSSSEQEIKSLVVAFRDDAELMKKLNIPVEDMRIVVDKIRYDK
ncbi:MAG: tetratricopeptide repeat protein [Muribaculaceae bacterium]|nr:tetratricopeptide repeat protein [Muribaculaceae bacterium]